MEILVDVLYEIFKKEGASDNSFKILALTKELERSRKAKESYESNQQRAIRLLENEYKGRLEVGAF